MISRAMKKYCIGPILHFEEGPNVPISNFRWVAGPPFKLWKGSQGLMPQGPSPTFIQWHKTR